MGPYSHYIMAVHLEPFFQPEDRREYYWGAVAPDIRYLANVRRDQTHLRPERIKELKDCYPNLHSFLSGYQVHILSDQIDIVQIISAAFPLNLLNKMRRKNPSPQQMIVLVEMYFLQTGAAGEALSGDHNAVLSDLGITPEQTLAFHLALQEYFDNRSAEAAVSAFQKIGWIQNTLVEGYMNAYHALQKQKILNSLLMLSIRNAKLDAQVADYVRSNMAD